MQAFDVEAYIRAAVGEFATEVEVQYIIRLVKLAGFTDSVEFYKLDKMNHFVQLGITDCISDAMLI